MRTHHGNLLGIAAALILLLCPSSPEAQAGILWFQGYDGTSPGISSQDFFDAPTYSTYAFAEFVVSGSGWHVTNIDTFGYDLGNPSMNISVNYAIMLTPNVNATLVATGSGIELPNGDLSFSNLNLNLEPGTYWLTAVTVRSSTDPQQFWNETTPVVGSEDYIQNPGGAYGFGTAAVPVSSVTGDTPRDLAFKFLGSPVPEPSAIALLATGILIVCGRAGIARFRSHRASVR